jgi:hypothetical protein
MAQLPREQGRAATVGDVATRVNVADELDRGEARWQRPGCEGEGERVTRRSRGGALTCGPGWHSVGRRGSNRI